MNQPKNCPLPLNLLLHEIIKAFHYWGYTLVRYSIFFFSRKDQNWYTRIWNFKTLIPEILRAISLCQQIWKQRSKPVWFKSWFQRAEKERQKLRKLRHCYFLRWGPTQCSTSVLISGWKRNKRNSSCMSLERRQNWEKARSACCLDQEGVGFWMYM